MLQLGAKSSIEINIFKFPPFSAYSPDPNIIRLIGKISSYSPVRPTPYRQRHKKKSIPTVKIIPTVEGVFLNEVRGNDLLLISTIFGLSSLNSFSSLIGVSMVWCLSAFGGLNVCFVI